MIERRSSATILSVACEQGISRREIRCALPQGMICRGGDYFDRMMTVWRKSAILT